MAHFQEVDLACGPPRRRIKPLRQQFFKADPRQAHISEPNRAINVSGHLSFPGDLAVPIDPAKRSMISDDTTRQSPHHSHGRSSIMPEQVMPGSVC